jgi:hypothetical protein
MENAGREQVIKIVNRATGKTTDAVIRPCVPSDKDALLKLAADTVAGMERKEFWGGAGREAAETDEWNGCFLAPNRIFGCFADGGLVAFSIYKIPDAEEAAEYGLSNAANICNTAIQHGVMVAAAYRGNSLQIILLNRLRAQALADGKKYIFATVHPENVYSRDNLIKAGFRFQSTKRLSYGLRDLFLLNVLTR